MYFDQEIEGVVSVPGQRIDVVTEHYCLGNACMLIYRQDSKPNKVLISDNLLVIGHSCIPVHEVQELVDKRLSLVLKKLRVAYPESTALDTPENIKAITDICLKAYGTDTQSTDGIPDE